VDKAPDAFRTISEVADELVLPQHVLRFWETRFSQIRPMKRGGGRRYYRPDDVDLLRGIRHLLYGEGYTIRGVQRILKDHGIKFVQSVWQAGAPQPAKTAGDVDEAEAAKTARSRRLFGLLPSLQRGDEDAGTGSLADERREPPIEDVTGDAEEDADEEDEDAVDTPADLPAVPLQSRPAIPGMTATAVAAAQPAGTASARLVADDIRKLQATLTELTECRRLLDAALAHET
jgi:DNA-binding transcriptional MerR regulator